MGGKRTLIAKGIYRDKSGVAIVVSVHGTPREFRRTEQQESYKTWDKPALIIERKRIDAREHVKATHKAEAAASLQADVDAYLQTLSGRTREDAEDLLDHWLINFRDRSRHTLTAMELRQHAATWTCAASTFNHRRQALISLYRALDGKHARNPARDIPKRKEVLGAPKALTYDVIRHALQQLPAGPEKAFLTLMAFTGLPHRHLNDLREPDWQGKRLRVTPRRKGAGTEGRWLPLSPEALQALKQIKQHGWWGQLDRYKLYHRWEQVGPEGTNPYSLRHSWITELYRRSNGDVLALQQLALHARLEQTQRYAAAALDDRMRALVVPRTRATTPHGKRSKTLHFGHVSHGRRKGARQRQNRQKSRKSREK